ncbi:MBL fold metallo-hydrolase [Hominisplanchenecus murintestinalis]|uniref:MBL fold metallo-hydrolase n=1 Tax=Hominisplanchenecus murintestinalis TaxID=2941517 RepID=UPI00203C2086|nr:MBL fold metallo-hydrolase [Hominisplanchenecus murintestinalis]
MDNWFSVSKIDDNTFAINEDKHWEETHCYLLCGVKNALLIDTGLGVANIKKVVDSLTLLPVLVVTTHIHWDHIGGHKYFENIAVHEAEKEWLSIKFPIPLQAVKHNLVCKPCDFPLDFSIDSYQLPKISPQQILHDGDCLDLGERKITVIHTPGHSPGHCCFYEPERKYLYSGDLIYSGCLDAFYPTTDPQLFWQSVKKIQHLDVERVLPAHHQLNIPVNIINRIEKAFSQLAGEGRLEQGDGIFDFADFQIHI